MNYKLHETRTTTRESVNYKGLFVVPVAGPEASTTPTGDTAPVTVALPVNGWVCFVSDTPLATTSPVVVVKEPLCEVVSPSIWRLFVRCMSALIV